MGGREMASVAPLGGPTITVVLKPEDEHPKRSKRVAAGSQGSASGPPALDDILDRYGASLTPLFEHAQPRSPSPNASPTLRPRPPLPRSHLMPRPATPLARFQKINLDALVSAAKLQELAKDLKAADRVESAYVTPPGVVPLGFKPRPRSKVVPPPVTPDFVPRQLYHKAAPIGFDTRWAATLPGGRGTGVTIIDCEWGWVREHESLARNFKEIIGENDAKDPDHGTAVVGVLVGDRNPGGITGIAPAAIIKAYSFGLSQGHAKYVSQDTAPVIQKAAASLKEGDVLLLEIHRPDPATPPDEREQLGYLPVEWWPEDFAAIKQATDNGIIVIEAAGNGFQDLDGD
ncbi:hypothetical protein OQA88_12445 [Cercophora sp. LCS_1]